MLFSGDRNEAKKVVKQMRQDLIAVAQDMNARIKEDPSEVKEISHYIEDVQDKIPIIQTLEKKLDIM
jgi:TolA-binding protein